MKTRELISFKLQKLKTIFDLEKVLSVNTDEESIAKYYKINWVSYSLFHNPQFIHMEISRNGSVGFLEQAVIVSEYINSKTKRVLELGCGRGANSIYLAKKYPLVDFTGIDLPNGQFDKVLKKNNFINNFHPEKGNFHDLSKYPKNSFDLVFVIEALCHSDQKDKVLLEANRILKKGGYFIVIDAFVNKEKLNSDEIIAKSLLEKGMCIPSFENYDHFKMLLKKNNFNVIYEEDDSENIMQSANHLGKIAKTFLYLPKLISRSIIKIFPPEFTYNAISGYLMPDFLKLRIAKYMVIVSKKLLYTE